MRSFPNLEAFAVSVRYSSLGSGYSNSVGHGEFVSARPQPILQSFSIIGLEVRSVVRAATLEAIKAGLRVAPKHIRSQSCTQENEPYEAVSASVTVTQARGMRPQNWRKLTPRR